MMRNEDNGMEKEDDEQEEEDDEKEEEDDEKEEEQEETQKRKNILNENLYPKNFLIHICLFISMLHLLASTILRTLNQG